MNKFFTHPMRPFFVGAAVLAILGVLVFFHQPRRYHPAPPNFLGTYAAGCIRRFFDYRFVGPDGFFRQPETCRYFDGGVVACCGCFIAVFTATCRIFRRRLLAGVAAVLRLADLARPQHRQLRPLNAARRIHRFSDGLCRQRRFELNCARKCI
ncbi:integral membrane protein [Neisseria gonorrhoeae]|nr:integral membrane protein [Neisseria gonorrhoeae]SBO70221.1 integral membrane protein [Neisseria gonorrhoeae]STZ90623.1 integral membrane protein [Neisseria gonorrhoeae]